MSTYEAFLTATETRQPQRRPKRKPTPMRAKAQGDERQRALENMRAGLSRVRQLLRGHRDTMQPVDTAALLPLAEDILAYLRHPALNKAQPKADSSAAPVVLYTDGACMGNPGPGGWGVVLLREGQPDRHLCGGEPATTNNRMELLAAVMALEALPEPCAATLYTDSRYLEKGASTWLASWKIKNWRTADNKPVKNQDLWQRLDAAAAAHKVDWRWVAGHAGTIGNETADRLAAQGLAEVTA